MLHRCVSLQAELATGTEVACWVRLALGKGHYLFGSWKITFHVTVQR